MLLLLLPMLLLSAIVAGVSRCYCCFCCALRQSAQSVKWPSLVRGMNHFFRIRFDLRLPPSLHCGCVAWFSGCYSLNGWGWVLVLRRGPCPGDAGAVQLHVDCSFGSNTWHQNGSDFIPSHITQLLYSLLFSCFNDFWTRGILSKNHCVLLPFSYISNYLIIL